MVTNPKAPPRGGTGKGWEGQVLLRGAGAVGRGRCCQEDSTHLIALQLLNKEGLPAVAELHVQVHRLPIDLNVYLQMESGGRDMGPHTHASNHRSPGWSSGGSLLPTMGGSAASPLPQRSLC